IFDWVRFLSHTIKLPDILAAVSDQRRQIPVIGLMQDVPLSIPMILDRAATLGHAMKIVSATPAGVDHKTWPDVTDRALRLAAALDTLGVPKGASVGSFAWNGHRHLELYFGVPCSGRVLHTINVRLHPDVVSYVVAHANDSVVFVDASLTSVLAPLRDRLDVRAFVVMEDGGEIDPAFAGDPRYEELIGSETPAETVNVDENDAASICFTSGTTGRPKAVVYSHRSVVLHSMGELMVDGHAIRRGDVILPLTPMIHVNCWGLPYTAGLAPASLVFAGADTSPSAAASLIESERPNVLAGIPTFWVQMDSAFSSGEYDLSSVERILCGGAEAAPALIERYTDRGLDFFHGWGMTEMSPSGTGNWIRAHSDDVEHGAKQGVPAPTVQMRIVSDDGTVLPWDSESVGEIQVKGPWVAAAYLDPADGANEERFVDGWLRTGDVGRVAPDGTLEIVDRTKDLIKSGGEWISSVELERHLAAHPAVAEVAVVAVPHDRWGERPAALVVLREGSEAGVDELLQFVSTRVASWQVPDRVELVDSLPKTGVGKIDKRRLRNEIVPGLFSATEPERTP
ncbi:MAG TPA: long-chain-fatty-acid--CoA ligase, partial [Acidimicrobiia bacterium]|nr:long-chain-fatty-acid--CoA ligase [Acidimicrobiia bacterium]